MDPKTVAKSLKATIVCPEIISSLAEYDSGLHGVVWIEIENIGKSAVEFDEITGFDRDVPGELRESNLSNAAVIIVDAAGSKKGRLYSCAEGMRTGPIPKIRLKPGEKYECSIGQLEQSLEPGTYNIHVLYSPLNLKTDVKRFRVKR